MSKAPLKQDFLDIDVTTFWEFVISAIQKLWGSSFFSKYLKFNLDFKNVGKNLEKVFLSEVIASEFVSLNSLY